MACLDNLLIEVLKKKKKEKKYTTRLIYLMVYEPYSNCIMLDLNPSSDLSWLYFALLLLLDSI